MTDFGNEGIEPEGLWVSIAELARLKGISRQSASERVDRLEKHGHIQTRRNGRSRFVELASFDLAVGQVGDATREIVAESRKLAPIANETLRDAQSDRARYDAKLKALEYGERVGQLVPLKGPHGIEAAIAKVVELLLRDLNKPLNWIPELMDAARVDERTLRLLLKKKLRELRAEIATHLAALAGEAAHAESSGIEIELEEEEV